MYLNTFRGKSIQVYQNIVEPTFLWKYETYFNFMQEIIRKKNVSNQG